MVFAAFCRLGVAPCGPFVVPPVGGRCFVSCLFCCCFLFVLWFPRLWLLSVALAVWPYFSPQLWGLSGWGLWLFGPHCGSASYLPAAPCLFFHSLPTVAPWLSMPCFLDVLTTGLTGGRIDFSFSRFFPTAYRLWYRLMLVWTYGQQD